MKNHEHPATERGDSLMADPIKAYERPAIEGRESIKALALFAAFNSGGNGGGWGGGIGGGRGH